MTIRITAIGSPKPKGSLRHVGHGRMVEQLAGSRPWRDVVKHAAIDAANGRMLNVPVEVDVVLTVAKPKSAPKTRRTWPSTRSSGDVDKHARNILDALVDAALIGDDAQVVTLSIRKVFPGEWHSALDRPGAVITVQPYTEPVDRRGAAQ